MIFECSIVLIVTPINCVIDEYSQLGEYRQFGTKFNIVCYLKAEKNNFCMVHEAKAETFPKICVLKKSANWVRNGGRG